MRRWLLSLLLVAGASGLRAEGGMPLLRLPTENDALLKGKPQLFYQYVDRNFEGEATKEWTAGQFGFVRDPARWNGKLIQTKFHEGIDIRPLERDEKGQPQDMVRAIAAGIVRHASDVPGNSNYGRYVVVEHDWGFGPVLSLYAHLQRVDVQDGAPVQAGDVLGVLGCSGAGLNLERAHVHLEITFLLQSHFQEWHDKLLAGQNHHGIYNGLNLVGVDPAMVFLQQKKNGPVNLPALVKSQPVAWKAVVPTGPNFELPARYPWLQETPLGNAPAAEISFARHGLPVLIRPVNIPVPQPTLVKVAATDLPVTVLTHHYVTRNKGIDSLTNSGARYLDLIAGTFDRQEPAQKQEADPGPSHARP